MFISPSLTYDIKGTASSYSWTDSNATSDSGFTSVECGTFTWTVTQTDGSAIDSIFTESYTSATKTISTYTTDFAKAATYSMRVQVQYTDYPTVLITKDFTIEVTSPCLTDSLTLDAIKFASPALTYIIGASSAALSWTDSAATSAGSLTSAQCGMVTWQVTQTDGVTPIDSNVFTEGDYTQTTKTITVPQTEDVSKAAVYDMKVKVYYAELT